jgi:hypothetical protein
MATQNFKNHRQVVYGYYLTTGVPILIILVLAIRRLFTEGVTELNVLLVLTGWVLLTLLFRARSFALKAQDRAIRAEEGLRYYQLSGKRLDPRLRIGQLIALRFASDEELVALAGRALAENLGNKEIKQAIRQWRPDTYRI